VGNKTSHIRTSPVCVGTIETLCQHCTAHVARLLRPQNFSFTFFFVALHSCCDKVECHYSNHELINSTIQTFDVVHNVFSLKKQDYLYLYSCERCRNCSYCPSYCALLTVPNAEGSSFAQWARQAYITVQKSLFPLKTLIFTTFHSVHTTSYTADYTFNSKTSYNRALYYGKLPSRTEARHGIPTTE
jgi:hypothetical protein